MALLGQGAQGVPIDYSSVGQSAWALADSTVSSIKGMLDTGVDVLEKRKEDKDRVKLGRELGKAMRTLYPEIAPALDPYLAELDNEENPLSQRSKLGAGMGDLINTYIGASKDAFSQKMQEREMAMAESAHGMDAARQGYDMDRINREMVAKEKAERDSAQTEAFVAPEVLKQVLAQTAAMEKSGMQVGIPASRLQEALNAADPGQQMSIAQAALAMMPKEAAEQINFNTPVTINGQPGTAATSYDPKTGKLRIIPVEGGTAWGDGSGGESLPDYSGESGVFRAQTTNYSLGKDAGGPDEMQDKWTNKGYSSTGKNLAPGIAAVNPKVYKHGTVFQDADSGEVFIAGDSHGNADPNVIDIYQPPSEYKREKRPRNMRVVGFEENVGKTPEQIAEQRAKWSRVAGQTITPGAVKTGKAKTPTEQAIDEVQLQKVKGDVEAQAAQKDKEQSTKQAAMANAKDAVELMDKLEKHPGFSSAVGASLVPDWMPATDKKGAQAIIEQLKGQAFLNAIQQLRGLGALSDAEGAKLQQAAARLDAGQSEKDFKAALGEYKAMVQAGIDRVKGMVAEEEAAIQRTSAADRLKRLQGK